MSRKVVTSRPMSGSGGHVETDVEIAAGHGARSGHETLYRPGHAAGHAESDGDGGQGDEDEEQIDGGGEIVDLRFDLAALHDEGEGQRVTAAAAEVDGAVDLDELGGSGRAAQPDQLLAAQHDVEIDVARQVAPIRRARRRGRGGWTPSAVRRDRGADRGR